MQCNAVLQTEFTSVQFVQRFNEQCVTLEHVNIKLFLYTFLSSGCLNGPSGAESHGACFSVHQHTLRYFKNVDFMFIDSALTSMQADCVALALSRRDGHRKRDTSFGVIQQI